MKRTLLLICAAGLALLAGCVSPAEQRAMDQQECSGYGFSSGSDAFAQCMMQVSQHRQSEAAADWRAKQAQSAADRRAQAAKDQADQDAWDRETHQGKYSYSSSSGSSSAAGNSSSSSGTSMPDLSGMNCTSTSTSSGSANNQTTTTNTSCHN